MSKVYLDAGHGRGVTGAYDPGAVDIKSTGDSLYTVENTVAVDMVNRVRNLINTKKCGVTAIQSPKVPGVLQNDMSKKMDDTESLIDAVKSANAADVDLYVSIHCNSNPKSTAHGFEVFYDSMPTEKYAKSVLKAFSNSIEKQFNIANRGITINNTFYVLRKTEMPAMLIEIGFISNVDEEKKLNDVKYRAALADAISDGICAAFGK